MKSMSLVTWKCHTHRDAASKSMKQKKRADWGTQDVQMSLESCGGVGIV